MLAAAGVTGAVATLELDAGDGYSTQVAASDVLACADCLLTFGDPGEYALADARPAQQCLGEGDRPDRGEVAAGELPEI